MGNLATAYVNAIIDNVQGRTQLAFSPTIYFHVLTAYDEATEAFTELSMTGTGYAAGALPVPAAASGRAGTNSGLVEIGPAAVDWPMLVGWYTSTGSAINSTPIAHGELLGPEIRFVVDASTDAFTATAHGLTAGQRVRLRNLGGALPGGLSKTVSYYVINPTANTFQLASTSAGTAIDVTTIGTGIHSAHLDYMQAVTQGGKLQIPAGYLSISIPIRS